MTDPDITDPATRAAVLRATADEYEPGHPQRSLLLDAARRLEAWVVGGRQPNTELTGPRPQGETDE